MQPDSLLAESRARLERLLRLSAWVLALACAAIGAASLATDSPRWLLLAVAIHLAPAVMLIAPSSILRLLGAWLAVMLILQAVLSLIVLPREVFTLPPNLVRRFEVPPQIHPGFSGVQTVTTDEKGFRVTDVIDYTRKPVGTLRIFAIGGSTTEQLLLDDRETWTHLLQQKLRNALDHQHVEVINAGASGTRAIHHLAMLEEIAGYQPDIVLLLVGVNDWNKAIREHFGSQQYGSAWSLIWQLQFENTLLGGTVRRTYDQITLSLDVPMTITTAYGSRHVNSLNRADKRELELRTVTSDYADSVSRFISRCRELDIICVLLAQPTAYQPHVSSELRARFWMTPPDEDYTLTLEAMTQVADTYNAFLTSLAARHHVPICNLIGRLPPTTEAFYDDCHFNESGARIYASELTACLLAHDSRVIRTPMNRSRRLAINNRRQGGRIQGRGRPRAAIASAWRILFCRHHQRQFLTCSRS